MSYCTLIQGDRAGIEDVVVGVARQQSDLNREISEAAFGPEDDAEAVVLVTDIDSISVKAQASGVPAVGSSKLRSILDFRPGWSRAGSGVETSFPYYSDLGRTSRPARPPNCGTRCLTPAIIRLVWLLSAFVSLSLLFPMPPYLPGIRSVTFSHEYALLYSRVLFRRPDRQWC